MSASVLTECVEAQSEGGLVGCCDMIGDEVWVEERGAGKRSVTGGVRAEVSPVAPTRSLRPEKKKGEFIKTLSLSFFFLSPKALSMPWVAVPILCSRLPAKLRKSLPQ
jgi:hypothetical protein